MADRTVVQGRFTPRLAESAVARARALALPSFQASGIDSAINSETSIGSGRGLSFAAAVRTPAGTGSSRIEAGPLVNHTSPRSTACKMAVST